jgi:Ca2+-binding RTX toxin-like protein
VDASGSTGGVNVDASNSDEDCSMTGGAGNDTLISGDGEDDLAGGDGEDTLTGGAAADTIDGGADDDTINGGDAVDEITGDTGADTFQFDAANADATDADLIDGFTVGSSGDVIAIEVATAGGGVAAMLADNALVTIQTSADNSFIVDTAGTGYPSFAAAEAAVEVNNAGTDDYALMFFNTATSRIELYIDANSSTAGAGVLLAAFEDVDNDTEADVFLASFVAENYDTF